jgi:acyl-coenzyme A thioesterase PaaI-like protein
MSSPAPPPRRWLQRLKLRLINVYPPFLGAGIRVTRFDFEAGRIEARLAFRPWTRNYLGTQFGGSLYALCDPFFVLLLSEGLGPGYTVWDKAATIRFLRPGRGPVTATFEVPPARLEEIRQRADAEPKVEPVFQVDILAADGSRVATVEKLLHVRKNPPAPARSNAG